MRDPNWNGRPGQDGLSHHAIVSAHPEVQVVAACDTTAYLTDVLTKYTGLKCYADLDRMLAERATGCGGDRHAVEAACRRWWTRRWSAACTCSARSPSCSTWPTANAWSQLAETQGLVTQVGYHYRFVGAFQEAARIVRSGALGTVHHVRAEAYGPVVLRAQGRHLALGQERRRRRALRLRLPRASTW